jgi:hypothetical protein
MRTRDAVLAYQETQSSDKSTKTIDLDITDPISALVFQFQAQNGTTSNQDNPLARCITKIEIIDGSEVICGLTFEQLQALENYKTGKQPMIREDQTGSDYTVLGATLLFGRYLWDKEFALELSRYKNPKLKITWDLSAIRAVSATTAWATGTFKISVTAKIMEQLGSVPGKVLAAKEIDSWTSGTSGDRRLDLPVDYKYSFMMLRSYVDGNDVDENISNIKITADTDAYVMMNRNTKEFRSEMARVFGLITLSKTIFHTHADTPWLDLQHEPKCSFEPVANDVHAYASWQWSGNFYLGLKDQDDGAISADTEIRVNYNGYGLWSTVPIPVGVYQEPDSYFDPTEFKKLEAVLTEAAAAACSIVVEQVR